MAHRFGRLRFSHGYSDVEEQRLVVAWVVLRGQGGERAELFHAREAGGFARGVVRQAACAGVVAIEGKFRGDLMEVEAVPQAGGAFGDEAANVVHHASSDACEPSVFGRGEPACVYIDLQLCCDDIRFAAQ